LDFQDASDHKAVCRKYINYVELNIFFCNPALWKTLFFT